MVKRSTRSHGPRRCSIRRRNYRLILIFSGYGSVTEIHGPVVLRVMPKILMRWSLLSRMLVSYLVSFITVGKEAWERLCISRVVGLVMMLERLVYCVEWVCGEINMCRKSICT